MPNKLLELLEPSAVCLHLQASNAETVISELGGKLHQAGYVKDSFVAAALAREKELPTGLPLEGEINAAIPHTDVEHVNKSGVAMATLEKPVVFQNMVNKDEPVPVRLVFLLSLEQPKAQIEMLQVIAGVLQNSEVVASLINAQNYSEVRQSLALLEE